MAVISENSLELRKNWFQRGVTLDMNGAEVLSIEAIDSGVLAVTRLENELRRWFIVADIHVGYQDDEFVVWRAGAVLGSVEVYSQHKTALNALKASIQPNDLTHEILRAIQGAVDPVQYAELEVLLRKI